MAIVPTSHAAVLAAAHHSTSHRVLLTAFGAGLTWGSTVLTWPEVKPGGEA